MAGASSGRTIYWGERMQTTTKSLTGTLSKMSLISPPGKTDWTILAKRIPPYPMTMMTRRKLSTRKKTCLARSRWPNPAEASPSESIFYARMSAQLIKKASTTTSTMESVRQFYLPDIFMLNTKSEHEIFAWLIQTHTCKRKLWDYQRNYLNTVLKKK